MSCILYSVRKTNARAIMMPRWFADFENVRCTYIGHRRGSTRRQRRACSAHEHNKLYFNYIIFIRFTLGLLPSVFAAAHLRGRAKGKKAWNMLTSYFSLSNLFIGVAIFLLVDFLYENLQPRKKKYGDSVMRISTLRGQYFASTRIWIITRNSFTMEEAY